MREFFNFIPEYQPDGTLSINKMKEKFEECRNGLSHAFEWMYRKRNGEDVPCEVKLVKLSHDSEEDIIVAYSRDLRELKKTLEINERLTRRANFDVLTECYSRAYFMEQVEAYLTDHKEEDNFSLFIIDIDDFKNVNDTYGHNIGDKTLKAVMQKAAEELPEDALTGRFGGDEFLIFIRNRTQKELEDIALQLVEAVAGIELFSGSHAFHVTISVGAVMWKQEYHNLDEMMKRADDALYMAKKQGKNCNVVW